MTIPKVLINSGNFTEGQILDADIEASQAHSVYTGAEKVSPPWSELLLRATGLSTDSIAFAEAST